jgi:hypothetical protein
LQHLEGHVAFQHWFSKCRFQYLKLNLIWVLCCWGKYLMTLIHFSKSLTLIESNPNSM